MNKVVPAAKPPPYRKTLGSDDGNVANLLTEAEKATKKMGTAMAMAKCRVVTVECDAYFLARRRNITLHLL
jgi:hypothetical protein